MDGTAALQHEGSALSVRNLSKTFTARPVLDRIDLEIQPGEVRALLGANGSGKSTLIKILSGYHTPDPGGAVTIGGRELPFGDAAASYHLGCRFVHQDLGLIDELSVLDNLSLSAGYPSRFATIRSGAARRRAAADLARVGLDLAPTRKVATLSPAQKTGVAVARASRDYASGQVKLIVMDEPTASLPEAEVDQLLHIVRTVAESGVAVLYVSHRLEDVHQVADRVTILRDGVEVATRRVADIDRSGLVHLLLGQALEDTRVDHHAPPLRQSDPALEVSRLGAIEIDDISFAAYGGEVLGLAGITGSGRERILEAVFGGAPRSDGEVRVDQKGIRALQPFTSLRAGVAYMPSDRKRQGGVMNLSARENMTLTDVTRFWRRAFLHRRAEVDEAKDWFRKVQVHPDGAVELSLSSFSGGNQQKVLFAKWFRTAPRVLLVDEPTQGVDVGAKAELHRHLIEEAGRGTAVVVSSSDVDELAAICHRVLIIGNGRITGTLEAEAVTAGNISRSILGHGEEARTA